MESTELKGQELLDLKAKMEGDGSGLSEIVEAAGYFTTKKDGSLRLNYTAFYRSMLEARGERFDAKGSGRNLAYRAKVNTAGHGIVGKPYIEMLGLAPGDYFAIKVGRKRIVIERSDEGSTDGEFTEQEAQAPVANEAATSEARVPEADLPFAPALAA